MSTFSSITEGFMESISTIGSKIADVAPTIIGAIVILLIGVLIAKLVRYSIKKAFKTLKVEELSERVGLTQMLNQFKITLDLSTIIGNFAYWLILLLFIISASESLGLNMVSAQIGQLVSYLPQLLTALLIFIVGIVAANFLKKAIYTSTNSMGLSGAKILSNIVFYVLIVFIGITSLNQAGIDTTLISSNVVIIMGAVLLAFSIAYGFAARDILTNILSSFYGRDRFTVGQVIKINETTGEIVKIDSISITLQTEDKTVVIPCKKLVSEEIEILSYGEEDEA